MKRPLFWTGIMFLAASAVFLLCSDTSARLFAVAFLCASGFAACGKPGGVLLSAAVILAVCSFFINCAAAEQRLKPFDGEVTGTMVITETNVYGGRSVLSGRANVTNGNATRTLPVELTVWGGNDSAAGSVLSFKAEVYRRNEENTIPDPTLSLTMVEEYIDAPAAPIITLALTRLRIAVCDALRAMVSAPYDGVLCAMIAGERSFLDEDIVSSFRSSGLSHMLVVSGMHLLVVSELVRRSLFKLSEGKRFAVMALFVWCFALFTGFGVSVVRAAIMVTIGESAHLFLRRRDTLTSLMAAGILIAAFSPSAITELSFLLSFGAVFGIALFADNIEKGLLSLSKQNGRFIRMLASSVSVSAAAQIGTLPVMAVAFGTIPVVGTLANIPAIPLMTPLLIFGALGVALSPLGALFGLICEVIITVLCVLAEVFGSLPLAKVGVGERYALLFVLFAWAVAVACAFLHPGKVFVRSCSLSMAAVFLLCSSVHLIFTANSVTAACFDESGVLALTKGSHAVIIGAPESGYEADRIAYYLERNNITAIDAVVTSSDGISSAVYSLAKRIPTGGVIAPDTPSNRTFCHAAGLSLYKSDEPVLLFGFIPLEPGENTVTLRLDTVGKEIYPREGLCVIIKEYSAVSPLSDNILWQIRTPAGGSHDI